LRLRSKGTDAAMPSGSRRILRRSLQVCDPPPGARTPGKA